MAKTILTVKSAGKDKLSISYPKNHPKAEKIKKWLSYLSPGYVEWLLQVGSDPHCSNCRAMDCENVGMGDDACPGFQFGEDW